MGSGYNNCILVGIHTSRVIGRDIGISASYRGIETLNVNSGVDIHTYRVIGVILYE